MGNIKSVKVTTIVFNCHQCPLCITDPREPDCCREMAEIKRESLYKHQTPRNGIADWCPLEDKIVDDIKSRVPDRLV